VDAAPSPTGAVVVAISRGHVAITAAGVTSVFACPFCGSVSAHPQDIEHGYCGRCHAFTGESASEGEP
jgi:ribosomal protein S27AE